MVLEDLLFKKKASILERCFQLILETYPADTGRFLKKEKDRFVNPIGYTIARELEFLYDGLLQGTNSDKTSISLDNIIRIRAVQDFSPSQAIIFIFLLKKAIREELEGEIREKRVLKELLEFESRIDKMALCSFDIYTRCREQIFELRVSELKAEREQALRLLERINRTYGEKEKK